MNNIKPFIFGFLFTGIMLFSLLQILMPSELKKCFHIAMMHDTIAIYKHDTLFIEKLLPTENNSEIKLGQVWIYQSSDPFEHIRDVRTVIAVKDGWVQYRRATGGIDSWPIDFFKIGSHLKKIN